MCVQERRVVEPWDRRVQRQRHRHGRGGQRQQGGQQQHDGVPVRLDPPDQQPLAQVPETGGAIEQCRRQQRGQQRTERPRSGRPVAGSPDVPTLRMAGSHAAHDTANATVKKTVRQ